jgi:O-antigen ligase
LISSILFLAVNVSDTFKSRAINTKNSIHEIIFEQNYKSSWGQRAACWIISGDMISENILLGSGFKDNLTNFRKAVINAPEKYKYIEWFPHLHSEYLEIITALGIIGLLLFLSIFYFIFIFQYKDSEMKVTKLIFLSVFFIAFFTDPFLEKKATLLLFGVFYGILLAQYRYDVERLNKGLINDKY